MPEAVTYRATADDAGQRLDQFVVKQHGDVSRARVQQLIEQGKVLVEGQAQRASYRVAGNEEVTITGALELPPLKAMPEDIPLDVIFEDDSIAIVNKAAGMTVHAGAGAAGDDEEYDPRTRGTLVNALLFRFHKLSKEGGELRPGIVHRLDKDTSGLMVVAKTDAAHRKLAEQFASRGVRKKYVALVHGWPRAEKGKIDAPIGRDEARRNRMSTRTREGRAAVTFYEVTRTLMTGYGKFALLEVTIETGRTHQIRVHLASNGHPVVGDQLYGAPAMLIPQAAARSRATPKHTKATRDRAVTELARELTEQSHGERHVATKRQAVKDVASSADKLWLPRNFLHAAELEFDHPKTGKRVRYQSELAPELKQFLERLAHQSL